MFEIHAVLSTFLIAGWTVVLLLTVGVSSGVPASNDDSNVSENDRDSSYSADFNIDLVGTNNATRPKNGNDIMALDARRPGYHDKELVVLWNGHHEEHQKWFWSEQKGLRNRGYPQKVS